MTNHTKSIEKKHKTSDRFFPCQHRYKKDSAWQDRRCDKMTDQTTILTGITKKGRSEEYWYVCSNCVSNFDDPKIMTYYQHFTNNGVLLSGELHILDWQNEYAQKYLIPLVKPSDILENLAKFNDLMNSKLNEMEQRLDKLTSDLEGL